MLLLLIIGSAVLGAIVGSFLNVCIFRYGTGLSIAAGRSQCPRCGKTLSAHELVPVVSFVMQRGRCTGCHSKISWQYPFVELCTAVLFTLVFLRQYSLYPLYMLYPHGLAYLIFLLGYYWVTVSILVVIALYDIRHKIIPQGLVYGFIILSVIKLFTFIFLAGGVLPLVDLLSPGILFIPFWFLWKISDGTWIGLGDGKLVFGIGALLGFAFGLSAIILGFWIGAVCCILLLLIERVAPGLMSWSAGLNRRSEIPLGPFLIIGTAIVLFWHVDVFGLTHILNASL